MSTALVVLTWNHLDDTLECLGSAVAMDPRPEHIVIADNGSSDGTPEAVARAYPDAVIARSPTNLGIAGGYNLGMRAAADLGADHILVTNNDVAFDPGFYGALLGAIQKHPDCGMFMPKIHHYYGDRSRLWCVGGYWRRFPPDVKMMGLDAPDAPRYHRSGPLEFAPSCTLLIATKALAQVGGFDDGYFFYYDDWDFSARLRQAGHGIRYVHDAIVYHKVSVSTVKTDRPARWWETNGRSSVRFYRKHHNAAGLAIMTAWFAARETAKRKPARVPPYLRGVLAAWRRQPMERP